MLLLLDTYEASVWFGRDTVIKEDKKAFTEFEVI